MTKPDYSEWLTPERLEIEETLWADPRQCTWPIFSGWIKRVAGEVEIQSVIEFGCGTGWTPSHIPARIQYVGVDANLHCLIRAMQRNPGRMFVHQDVRRPFELTFDLTCAFSFLKHFGLHEWDKIVRLVLSRGRYGLFTMPVGEETKDDGVDFPHVWVTHQRLVEAVNLAGHEITHAESIRTGEAIFVTRMVDAQQ